MPTLDGEPEFPVPGEELPSAPDLPDERRVPTHIFPPDPPFEALGFPVADNNAPVALEVELGDS